MLCSCRIIQFRLFPQCCSTLYPVVGNGDLIRITCHLGKMTFHFDKGENHGTLTMTLSGGAFTYYLTVVPRTTPLEFQERQSPSQEVCISQVSRPGNTQIPPTPAPPSSALCIVPPGVPFHIPCPHCQYLLHLVWVGTSMDSIELDSP